LVSSKSPENAEARDKSKAVKVEPMIAVAVAVAVAVTQEALGQNQRDKGNASEDDMEGERRVCSMQWASLLRDLRSSWEMLKCSG
jgi:hypothetical protein